MKTILTKIMHKSLVFEYIQGYVSTRHYILPFLINNDKELHEDLKILNGIKKENQLSPNFINNLYTFISDRMLFRIINQKDMMENKNDEFINEEEGEENNYKFLKKKILNYYKVGKYCQDINIKINQLKKYLPNKKEFALFIFDFLLNKNENQLLSFFPEFNLENKNDINKFLSYYDKNKISLENEEKIDPLFYEQIKEIYKKMNRKIFLSLAFIGNKNSGKSTTMGHLLYSTGNIINDYFIETRNIANSIGHPSYKYSWLIDKLTDERNNRKSIMYHLNKLETEKYEFNLIDLPGDFHFKKNIIKGLSLADAAVFVISANNENEEKDNIKNYLILAFTLGIRQLIIAINKMDYSNYSQKKFLEIKMKMIDICENIGFDIENIQFIPYSGYTGLNLINNYEDDDILQTKKMAWYKGKTLFESLDEIKPVKRNFDGPLKISVFKIYKIVGIGTVAAGKILSGNFISGDFLSFIVGSTNKDIISTGCQFIEINHRCVYKAVAGDVVGLNVSRLTIRDLKDCRIAFRFNFNMDNLCPIIISENADNLRIKIFVVHKNTHVRVGSDLTLFCYTTRVNVRILKIEYIVDRANKILEKGPKEIKNGCFAILLIKIFRNNFPRHFQKNNVNNNYYEKQFHKLYLYCEKYKNDALLGSFALFIDELFAVGKIIDINVLPPTISYKK